MYIFHKVHFFRPPAPVEKKKEKCSDDESESKSEDESETNSEDEKEIKPEKETETENSGIFI